MSVVKFYPKDAAKDADAVLEQSHGNFSEVLIIGWDNDGVYAVINDEAYQEGSWGRPIF